LNERNLSTSRAQKLDTCKRSNGLENVHVDFYYESAVAVDLSPSVLGAAAECLEWMMSPSANPTGWATCHLRQGHRRQALPSRSSINSLMWRRVLQSVASDFVQASRPQLGLVVIRSAFHR